MTTNRKKMPKRTQFAITGIGAVILAVLVIFLLDASDQTVYLLARLFLSLLGFVACATILRQSINRVRRISDSPEQRLRMVTIVLLLAEIAGLLALGAVVTWNDPLPTNPASAIIGMMIRGSLAYAASILAITQPESEAKQTIIDAATYAEFSEWKRQRGQVAIDGEEYTQFIEWKQANE